MRRAACAVLGLICGALLLGTARAYVIPPEPLLDLGVGVGGGVEIITGTWTAGASLSRGESGSDVLQLTLRRSRRGGESQHSFACPVAALKDLAPDQLSGPRDVSFELARDAGVLRFGGRFQASAGAGQFRFVPSADYLAGMRDLGYPGIDAEKAYTFAALDLSRRFVQDLGALGRSGLTLEQLVALRTHGADAAFVRALNVLGYDYLSADRLVAFRIHGVTPEFIAQMRAVGYARLAPLDLVSFRVHGVSAEFVRELQALGYRGAPAQDLVNLRIHGVTPDLVRRVNANGRATVPLTRLVDLRSQGRQP